MRTPDAVEMIYLDNSTIDLLVRRFNLSRTELEAKLEADRSRGARTLFMVEIHSPARAFRSKNTPYNDRPTTKETFMNRTQIKAKFEENPAQFVIAAAAIVTAGAKAIDALSKVRSRNAYARLHNKKTK